MVIIGGEFELSPFRGLTSIYGSNQQLAAFLPSECLKMSCRDCLVAHLLFKNDFESYQDVLLLAIVSEEEKNLKIFPFSMCQINIRAYQAVKIFTAK